MTVGPDERGAALLPVMLVMFLFAAIAFGATAVVRIEVMVAERFRQSAEAQYAAEAGLELVLSELRSMPTWAPVVSGLQRSALVDGEVAGQKAVPGGGTVTVCCDNGSAADRLTIETRLSPLPARRAVDWKPYLWTPFDRLVRGEQPSRLYIAVWVAGQEDVTAGEGEDGEAVLVRADALDPGGRRRTIEAMAQRRSPDALRVLAWREVR
jgi:hypothetical protein